VLEGREEELEAHFGRVGEEEAREVEEGEVAPPFPLAEVGVEDGR